MLTSASEIPALDRRAARRGRRLFATGCILLAGSILYFSLYAPVEDRTELLLGLLMLILAFVPSLRWARRAKFGLPLFESFLATTATAYALPLLTGHQELVRFDPATISRAALGVILFQAGALAGFFLARVRVSRTPFWTEEIVTENFSQLLLYGMFFSAAYVAISAVTSWIPDRLESILRAVAFGIGIIATFIQSRRWGQGELSANERLIFSLLLAVQIVFSWVSLLLVGGISILVLGLLGYISGGKRIPFVTIALVVSLLTVLHNGKTAMREKYWEVDHPAPTLRQLPDFFGEWFADGLAFRAARDRPQSTRLLERSSLFHLICLVVSLTPDREPYLHGLTYADVPGQFVPRFLWPNKPVAHISTYRLAVYYGLQTEEETKSTTIGFGLLTEAYANFGLLGLSILGAVFGFVFRWVDANSEDRPLLTYGGLFTIVLIAWSFQTELTMSIWLGSLLQACVAVLALPFFLKNILGQER